MNGTMRLATSPMRRMPPTMTAPTASVSTSPLIQCGTPKYVYEMSATFHAWNMLPPVTVETRSVTQKMPPDDDADRRELRAQRGEPAPHDVHRAAVRVLRVRRIAEQHRLRDLGHLERHADRADDPHPEQRARTAERDRDRDARDVAKADGRGERGRQRLEVIDRAGIG